MNEKKNIVDPKSDIIEIPSDNGYDSSTVQYSSYVDVTGKTVIVQNDKGEPEPNKNQVEENSQEEINQ